MLPFQVSKTRGFQRFNLYTKVIENTSKRDGYPSRIHTRLTFPDNLVSQVARYYPFFSFLLVKEAYKHDYRVFQAWFALYMLVRKENGTDFQTTITFEPYRVFG